jgi:hypothetical protein
MSAQSIHNGHALWPYCVTIARSGAALLRTLWPRLMAMTYGHARRSAGMATPNGHAQWPGGLIMMRMATRWPRLMATHNGHALWPHSVADTEASESHKSAHSGHALWPFGGRSENTHTEKEGLSPPPSDPGWGGGVIRTANREQNTKISGPLSAQNKLRSPSQRGRY